METATRRVKKILLAVHHYPPRRVGGAELLAQRMARWLTRRGIQVLVVCIENVTRGSETLIHFRDEMEGTVRVRRLDLTLERNADLSLWYDAPELRTQLEMLVAEWQPDVLHLISGYLMGVPSLDAARAHNIPTVVTLTDFWFLCPTIQLLRGDGSLCDGPEPSECARCLYDERRVWRALDARVPNLTRAFWHAAAEHPALGAPFALPTRLTQIQARRVRLMNALNQVDALLPLTHFVVEMHRRNGFVADIPIAQIDGFDLGDFDSFTPRDARPNEIHFGYLGQVTPIKGVDVLLRAFLRLKQNASADKQIYLHIHGKLNADSAYANQLRALAANCPEIIFHGAYEHRRALELLNALDVVVIPSMWYENVPRVIFEAFAARRPVIGTRVGGISEVVRENQDGLLFERGSATDLARVMQRVVDEPGLLLSLAQNIPATRTLEQDMQAVFAMYERVLAARTKETSR